MVMLVADGSRETDAHLDNFAAEIPRALAAGVASVLAIGGSWMVPPEAVRSGNWARAEVLAREAIAIARRTESR